MTCYLIVDKRDGRQVCECGSIDDALMMVGFDPHYREIRQRKLILDQIVDVSSTQMPDDKRLKEQVILPESQAVAFAP
jgi:hypothetical protein